MSAILLAAAAIPFPLCYAPRAPLAKSLPLLSLGRWRRGDGLVVCMAPEEEKMTIRSPLDFPILGKQLTRMPTTDFQRIPIIDVSGLVDKIDDPTKLKDKELQQVARQLDSACKEAGFFYVKGHGIPDSMIKEVRDVSRIFFSLPYDEKAKIKLTRASGYRGYQRIGDNLTNGKLDMHEAINCYKVIEPGIFGDLARPLEGPNLWPEYPSNFRTLMEEYWYRVTELGRKIMRGIALAIGGPVDAFEGEVAGDTFCYMRILGYPVPTDIPEKERTDTGCGAHADYGLLALINQDENIDALEVMNKSGQWICATPIPGTFVCNIGDMLKVLTNGLYEPTIHRVINKSSNYRVSIGIFYETNFNTCPEPLEFCKEKTGGIAKFRKVVYGEYLVRKVLKTFAELP